MGLNTQNYKVSEITEEATIEDFIIKNSPRSRTEISETRVLTLGLYFHNELLVVAQFGYPRTSEMQSEYTGELYRLVFKDNVEIPEGKALIDHYKKVYKPADFFTYSNNHSSIYKNTGMVFQEGVLEKTKFRGKTCCQCLAQKTAHTRFHKNKIQPSCTYCVPSFP